MGFISNFKAFAVKGNVLDLAVGVIIGGAFGKIVASAVNDILMPPIGLLLGGTDFKALKYVMKAGQPAVMEGETVVTPAVAEASINYGMFLQNVIDFTIVALFIFIVINSLQKLQKKKEEAPAPPPPAPEPTAEEKLLTEIRDLLKK